MSETKENYIPKHIAFIMDGNGRWAKKHLMPREYGHSVGAKKFREIAQYCADKGVENVTVYAFSTENWKRPQKEVDAIMRLFREYISEAERDFGKSDVRILFIGNRNVFDEDLQNEMSRVEKLTSDRKKTLCIAINYGGRGEIVDAVNTLIALGKKNITEDDITRSIYSGAVPPPDMIVRTGGELRLSNFLLWQSDYAELFFTETLWPDLTTDEVDCLIETFYQRNRRYGGI
ncbi:MAG: di-trans,poly-cis-decaprenylcistransferase [Clostridia bacterium]|nr:di-trans,poly-cis-decaprenylcistransferase [Clostridia bacterium]